MSEMIEQAEQGNPAELRLHRIYTKNSSFESNALTLDLLKNPVQPMVELQAFANAYARGDNVHEALLGLKIEAKHV